jgi:hypothetical protein
MDELELLTAKEVEDRYKGKITARRALQAARTGVLPRGVVIRLGRQVRFSAAALRSYLEGGGAALPGGWRRKPAEEKADHSAATAGR